MHTRAWLVSEEMKDVLVVNCNVPRRAADAGWSASKNIFGMLR